MDNKSFLIYLIIMAGSTYLIRAVPFAAIRKKIENPFICSFLYYIPYTVLSAMTFPAALYATGNTVAASLGLISAAIFAVKGKSLTTVAVASCVTVLLAEIVMTYILP